ncbi:protein of unknown function (plasmid) [Cupriavidus neocaledonicus]|uniref:Uncharacterized protein n=1 Tax=Cupriavidus neocaledonicus TaxID=1040979 RepID=A0A375HSY0_9BURK|nr:hypothetical protein CBM2605_B110027 [Cupriavidus neocaledonicus]SPD59857.1 protein of unknown function [Cupriavidus neocaledonicus]
MVREPYGRRGRGADARGAYHSFYRTYQNIYSAQNSINFI